MRCICTLFIFIFLLNPVSSQKYQLTWGEVPDGDRLMESFPADTLADAVLLGEIGQLFFRNVEKGCDYILNVHRRIKLLNKKAFAPQGQVSIPLYYHDDTEHLLKIEAQTITPDGQVYPLSRKDFFYEEKNQYWTYVKFTFPQLQAGAVIEYRYTLQSKDVVQARSWYFQKEIPVRFSQLSLDNSSYLSFVTLFEGAEYMQVVSKEKDEVRLRRGDMRFLFSDDLYVMENAPALREEAYITTINDYCVRLRFQLSEVRRYDGTKKPFLSTWEQSAKDLINSSFFGGRYLPKKAYKDLLQVLEDQSDLLPKGPEAKMRAIYRFIVGNVHWDGTNGIQPKRDLFEAFETGKAAAPELNFMLLALLNAEGIQAHPVLTSTRDHGRMTQQYPLMEQFNYVLVLVSIGGQSWLLDATHPLRPPGMPGIQTLNKKAWVVDPDWPQWINLEVPASKNLYFADLSLAEDGRIRGKLQATYHSYSAWLERQQQQTEPEGQYWLKRLQIFHPEAVLDSVRFQKIDELEENFINRVFFTIPGSGISGGDFLYLQPAIYAHFSENPFKQENRNFPVDFPYPFEEEWRMILHLPPNCETVELPERLDFSLPKDQGTLAYECKTNGNQIYLNFRLLIRQDLIAPEDYPELKELFDRYVQQMQARIVLKIR